MKIKKLIVSLCLLAISALVIAQTGTGWTPVRSKQNFKDSTYFNKGITLPVIGDLATELNDTISAIGLLVPYTGATTSVNLGANALSSTGKISNDASVAGDGTMRTVNSNTTDESKALYARQHAESGTGDYYGVYGLSNGSNTGINIGVYGSATDATINYAGYFNGNVVTTGSSKTGSTIVGMDTCLGVQTKSVLNIGVLKVQNTCTLNGLSGGVTGQVLIIFNNGNYNCTLKYNGSGTQKFYFPNTKDYTFTADGESLILLYQGSYWYIIGVGYNNNTVNDTSSVTKKYGRMVFQQSDSSLYVCKYITPSGKKCWWKIQ